jgi:hypothetical protein
MYDLLGWHRALHEITGHMALHWHKVQAGDLRTWAQDLRTLAAAMEEAANTGPVERVQQADAVPDWLLEMVDT